jgi:DnaJ-class molecular chaperone
LVQVIVKTPKNLSKRQEQILKEFEELSKHKDKDEGWKKLFKAGS